MKVRLNCNFQNEFEIKWDFRHKKIGYQKMIAYFFNYNYATPCLPHLLQQFVYKLHFLISHELLQKQLKFH